MNNRFDKVTLYFGWVNATSTNTAGKRTFLNYPLGFSLKDIWSRYDVINVKFDSFGSRTSAAVAARQQNQFVHLEGLPWVAANTTACSLEAVLSMWRTLAARVTQVSTASSIQVTRTASRFTAQHVLRLIQQIII